MYYSDLVPRRWYCEVSSAGSISASLEGIDGGIFSLNYDNFSKVKKIIAKLCGFLLYFILSNQCSDKTRFNGKFRCG